MVQAYSYRILDADGNVVASGDNVAVDSASQASSEWIVQKLGQTVNAKVIPTASASMLVATAITNIVFAENESFALFSSASPNDSFIIFTPMSESRINATQWSIDVIYDSKAAPKK